MPAMRRWLVLGLSVGLLVSTLIAGVGAQTAPSLSNAEFDALFNRLTNWGRWGREDQRGTLNLITASVRQSAAQEVRDGFSVSLARMIITTQDAADAQRARLRMLGTGTSPNNTAGLHTDEFTIAPHGAAFTHFDAPAHFFYRGELYNGVPRTVVTEHGAEKLSVDVDSGGVFTRGVLLDIPRCKGVAQLTLGSPILAADFEACAKSEGLSVRSGDAVLIRTGRAEGAPELRAGVHYSAAEWFKRQDVAVVGTDSSIDQWPSGVQGIRSPIHVLLLVAMGTPILDNLELDELARAAAQRRRWTFLFALTPLRIQGATGSPVNPLALF
jgi:kynurenine formamidase